MIVLRLDKGEASALAETILRREVSGVECLLAWDPIDRAIKVKDGIWSPPLGEVIIDD